MNFPNNLNNNGTTPLPPHRQELIQTTIKREPASISSVSSNINSIDTHNMLDDSDIPDSDPEIVSESLSSKVILSLLPKKTRNETIFDWLRSFPKEFDIIFHYSVIDDDAVLPEIHGSVPEPDKDDNNSVIETLHSNSSVHQNNDKTTNELI